MSYTLYVWCLINRCWVVATVNNESLRDCPSQAWINVMRQVFRGFGFCTAVKREPFHKRHRITAMI